jgi:drug/metabolite transporter (DMT)-like permease
MTAAGGRVLELARRQGQRFFVKGVTIAVVSGMLYGLYSAFVISAEGTGVWGDWFSGESTLTAFTQVYVLGMLACGLNDSISALWAMGLVGIKGKLADLWRSIRSKPGLVMVVCAVIGGPLANGAYLIALKLAGPAAAPITALCPVVGAVIGRVMFKQAINARMAVGIGICLTASFMIGSTSLGGDAPPTMALGLLIALIAAVGWGVEGAVAGYGTVLIDYQIGITIRQLTSGILNLGLFVPVLCLMAGGDGLYGSLLGGALTDGGSLALFAVSGLFCFLSFGLWYRGNSMCGTALGMACNGSYSFWTPLFCWLVLGLGFGWADQAVAPIVWVAAPVLFVGLVLVALNPLELLRWREQLFQGVEVAPETAAASRPDGSAPDSAASSAAALDAAPHGLASTDRGPLLPVNYAVLRHLADHGQADADGLMEALGARYRGRRAFRRSLIVDALAAAEKNGVLEVAAVRLNATGEVTVEYRPTATGVAMIQRFIGAKADFAATR